MKLYKTTIQTGADSDQVKWSGSKDQAGKDRVEFKKLGITYGNKKVLPETEEVDVPTDKAGLIEFLNSGAA